MALPGGALHYTPRGPHTGEPLAALVREARLLDRPLVVSVPQDDPGALVRALSVPDVPVVFTGSRPYDPQWCDDDPLVLDAPRLGTRGVHAWAAALRDADPGAPTGTDGPGFDLAATVAPYHLGTDRVTRAVRAARALAAFDGTPSPPAICGSPPASSPRPVSSSTPAASGPR